jgi:hypothetical protein
MFMGGESVLFFRIPTNSLNGLTLCFASSQKKPLGQFTSQLFLFACWGSCLSLQFRLADSHNIPRDPILTRRQQESSNPHFPALLRLLAKVCEPIYCMYLLWVESRTLLWLHKIRSPWSEKRKATQLGLENFLFILLKLTQICIFHWY